LTGETLQPQLLRAAILGSDLLLASLPAEPVQLVHAAKALGYDLVVPASWGDEVIAAAVLDDISSRPSGTSIFCSCPRARQRMLAAGNELSPFLVQTVSPPVAAARYLRALHGSSALHVTYVGTCPGAVDDSIDERLGPAQFIDRCRTQGVSVAAQPRVFDSLFLPDRRRHLSLPGGLPTAESLRATRGGADVISLDGSGLAYDVTQSVISGRAALLDPSPAVGCACSGFLPDAGWVNGRETLVSLEPPRAAAPVIDQRIDVDLDLPGQTPTPLPYEESIPLSVVVGADLSPSGVQDVSFAADRSLRAEVNEDQSSHADESQTVSVSVVRERVEFDLTWPDDDLSEQSVDDTSEPTSRDSAAPVEQPVSATAAPSTGIVSSTPTGTPTGTPTIRTPIGPLPRAYLMVRRRRATGEHATVSPVNSATIAPRKNGEHETQANAEPVESPRASIDGDDATPASQERKEPVRAAQQPASDQSRTTVNSVLDILAHAIRNVVEP
jgi:hypothetical protein